MRKDKEITGVERYNTLACIIKNATCYNMQYSIVGNDGDKDIETVLLVKQDVFFGFYFLEKEIEFFVHKSISDPARYIYFCKQGAIHRYMVECLQDAEKFIENNKENLIDVF